MFEWDDRMIFHPGYYINEIMEHDGLSYESVAQVSDLSITTIIELVAGTRALTPDIAVGLERAFGPSAQFWLNLEQNYRYLQCLKAGYKWNLYQKKEE